MSAPIFKNRFAGKVLVVTGAAQGIGRAVALRAVAEGGQVVFVDRADFVGDVAKEAKSRRAAAFNADLETHEGAAAAMRHAAAIITEEGCGNPDTDICMNAKNLEEAGVRTVVIGNEVAGQDGSSQGLADVVREMDAYVSCGNINEVVVLPPMERVIGDIRAIASDLIGEAGAPFGTAA